MVPAFATRGESPAPWGETYQGPRSGGRVAPGRSAIESARSGFQRKRQRVAVRKAGRRGTCWQGCVTNTIVGGTIHPPPPKKYQDGGGFYHHALAHRSLASPFAMLASKNLTYYNSYYQVRAGGWLANLDAHHD